MRCFVHFMDFSRESGEGCAERRSSIHYAFIMRAEKGVLRYLKSREEAAAKGSKTQKKNAGTKKKHQSFDWCFVVEISGIEPLTS